MKVLVITGDRSFKAGNPRYELQRSAVEELVVVYWGRGALWPAVPKGEFDVVTAQDPFWRGLFAWHVARRLAAKFNVQVHTDLSAQNFVRHVMAQIVLRHADSVRVVSEKIRSQISHPKIFVLPIFVDLERFSSIERNPEPNTILWLGRFEEEKDPLLAVHILEKMPSAKLIMLGAGDLEEELRIKAKDLPVEFPGWQDPTPYLARASVVLCTSRHESWGASLVEALAAGVPVVAPNVGIAREAGAIVVPRSELAEAVSRALQSRPSAELKIPLLSKDAWVSEWRKSLEA